MNTKIIKITCMFLLETLILACNENKPQTIAMTGFTVSPTSITLFYGGTPNSQQITATAEPEDATDVKFTWYSENGNVAAVSQTGLVTATGAGSTNIVVTSGDKTQRVPVDVVDGQITEFILAAEVTNRQAHRMVIDNAVRQITFDLEEGESKTGVNIQLTLADGVTMESPASEQADYDLTNPAQIKLLAEDRQIVFTITAGVYINKQVWMNPLTVSSNVFSSGAWELSALNQWTNTQSGLDVICVFIDAFINSAVTDAQIEDFCDMLKATKLKLAIELGGLCSWYQSVYIPGTDDFANQSVYGVSGEFSRLSKLIDALKNRDMAINYLNFDHPFMRAMNPTYENVSPKMSISEAAEQLYLAMAMWQKECPGIQFNYVVNFPNHGWKGGAPITGNPIPLFSDYFYGDFYDDFQEICRLNETSGIRMNAIIVDFPYNPYLNSNMAFSKSEKRYRIKDLEIETKYAGMKFGIIFNSEDEGMGRNGAGNRQYYTASLEFIDDYLLNGGDPDYFINESWYPNPNKLLPEDEPYTITNLTMEIIKRVKK